MFPHHGALNAVASIASPRSVRGHEDIFDSLEVPVEMQFNDIESPLQRYVTLDHSEASCLGYSPRTGRAQSRTTRVGSNAPGSTTPEEPPSNDFLDTLSRLETPESETDDEAMSLQLSERHATSTNVISQCPSLSPPPTDLGDDLDRDAASVLLLDSPATEHGHLPSEHATEDDVVEEADILQEEVTQPSSTVRPRAVPLRPPTGDANGHHPPYGVRASQLELTSPPHPSPASPWLMHMTSPPMFPNRGLSAPPDLSATPRPVLATLLSPKAASVPSTSPRLDVSFSVRPVVIPGAHGSSSLSLRAATWAGELLSPVSSVHSQSPSTFASYSTALSPASPGINVKMEYHTSPEDLESNCCRMPDTPASPLSMDTSLVASRALSCTSKQDLGPQTLRSPPMGSPFLMNDSQISETPSQLYPTPPHGPVHPSTRTDCTSSQFPFPVTASHLKFIADSPSFYGTPVTTTTPSCSETQPLLPLSSDWELVQKPKGYKGMVEADGSEDMTQESTTIMPLPSTAPTSELPSVEEGGGLPSNVWGSSPPQLSLRDGSEGSNTPSTSSARGKRLQTELHALFSNGEAWLAREGRGQPRSKSSTAGLPVSSGTAAEYSECQASTPSAKASDQGIEDKRDLLQSHGEGRRSSRRNSSTKSTPPKAHLTQKRPNRKTKLSSHTREERTSPSEQPPQKRPRLEANGVPHPKKQSSRLTRQGAKLSYAVEDNSSEAKSVDVESPRPATSGRWYSTEDDAIILRHCPEYASQKDLTNKIKACLQELAQYNTHPRTVAAIYCRLRAVLWPKTQ